MTLTYKNTPIYYETFGEGPAIVLLHGFLESSTMWKFFIPNFTKKHTLLAIDFPGHGKSGVFSETHSMELMAEVVDEILQLLQINKSTFIGHSMGGYVALAYAEMFPKKVEKIVLINTTSEADSQERKVNRNRALSILDQNPRAYISMAIGNLFAESSRKSFYDGIETLKKEAYTFPVEGIKAAIKGMRDRKDRTQILHSFNGEKYMVLSKEDPIIPISTGKLMAKNCNVPLEIIEGGHMSLIENLDAVVKFVKDSI